MQAGLPAWSERLIAELKAADQRAEALVSRLSGEQLNWRPSPGAWSIGQCLEHLHITNEVYLRALARSLEGQRFSKVPEIRLGWFSRWFVRNYIAPVSNGRRTQAPKKIRPESQVGPSVLESFLRSNEAARDFVSKAADYDVNRIRFQNPFVRGLRFTVGAGLEIVSQHQRRHLLQAERVKESLRLQVL
jgi:hypothetical protein